MLRFAAAGRSVAVYTETLGAKRHHGKVALLINEHSASAAEMVAAFAAEYRLATVVGTKTAGRLVATSVFKVGSDIVGSPFRLERTTRGRARISKVEASSRGDGPDFDGRSQGGTGQPARTSQRRGRAYPTTYF